LLDTCISMSFCAFIWALLFCFDSSLGALIPAQMFLKLLSVSWKSHCKDQILYCCVHFLQFLTATGSRMITVLNVTSSKECIYTRYLLFKKKIVQRFLWSYYLHISCTHHSYLHPPTHCKLLLNSQIKVNCQISCTLPNHAFSVPAIYLWKNFELENEEALRRTEAFRNPIQIYSVSNHEMGGGVQESAIITMIILSWLKMPVCNRTAAHKNLPNVLSCDTAAFIPKAHN
jgi:hypothetical protein